MTPERTKPVDRTEADRWNRWDQLRATEGWAWALNLMRGKLNSAMAALLSVPDNEMPKARAALVEVRALVETFENEEAFWREWPSRHIERTLAAGEKSLLESERGNKSPP